LRDTTCTTRSSAPSTNDRLAHLRDTTCSANADGLDVDLAGVSAFLREALDRNAIEAHEQTSDTTLSLLDHTAQTIAEHV